MSVDRPCYRCSHGVDVQTNLRNPGPDRLIRLRLDKLARQFEAAGNKFEHISRLVLDKHRALSARVPLAGESDECNRYLQLSGLQ